MLNEYDIINEYGGNIRFLLNEYDWKFEFSLKISLLLQSNKLGRNYFKEKQLKNEIFIVFMSSFW